MNRQKTITALTVIIGLASTGCFGIRRDQPTTVSPTAPILLRPAAAELKGKNLDDILTRAESSGEDVPLTSHLIRRSPFTVG